jgi:arylsulfatase A-like enzyme
MRYHSLVVFLVTLVVLSAPTGAATRTPNIILILADDLGAETIGAYGGESYQTPRLDRMAAEGVRFEHGHAQPLCTPSRVKIMTGQYNFRNYQHFGYLDPAEVTFAHLLGKSGYATAVVGKWQLFNNRFEDIAGALPADAGFDEYTLWQLKAEQRGSRYWAPLIDHDGDVRQYGEDAFGPDVLNTAALEFIEANRDRSFFLYYPMVLPHAPFVTTPDMRDEDAGDQQRFSAMVAYMDKLVGRVLDKVQALGLEENTLILFIGDNGTDRDIVSRYRGAEVEGAKGETLNTGSRVPYIAWGPGIVNGDRISSSLVNLNDVLPTLAELAGAELPATRPRDGTSLVPVLRGDSELSRENLFIHFEPRWPTARPARYAFDRRWKFYEDGRFYDIQADPLERRALAPGALDREGLVAYRALQARVLSLPGELDAHRRWVPTVALVLVGAALLIAITIFFWVARLVRGLPDEQEK